MSGVSRPDDDVSRLQLHHLIDEPYVDPGVIFGAFAFGQARVATRHIQDSVLPALAGRERTNARLLLETIRRGGILQENVVDEIRELVRRIDPLVEAGTKEEPVWYSDADGACDSCRIEVRRTEGAEALFIARIAVEALAEEIELTLDVIQSGEAVDAARSAAATRRGALAHQPILFPENDH